MNEADLTRKLKKHLIDEGAYAVKVHGNRFTVGVPDIVGCYRGRMLGLEVKLPGKEKTLTELQASTLRKIREAGGVGEVVVRVGQIDTILDSIDEEFE